MQYTLTDSGTRLVVWTDGSAFHIDMPPVAGELELGKPWLESQRGNPRFAMKALGGMTNEMAELGACAAVLVALDCMDNSETGQHVGQDGR